MAAIYHPEDRTAINYLSLNCLSVWRCPAETMPNLSLTETSSLLRTVSSLDSGFLTTGYRKKSTGVSVYDLSVGLYAYSFWVNGLFIINGSSR